MHSIKRTSPFITFAAAALILITASTAHAGPKAWTSAVSGNWSDGTKWTPAGAPATGDDVSITVSGATSYTVTLDASPTLASLTLGASSGATFQTLAASG